MVFRVFRQVRLIRVIRELHVEILTDLVLNSGNVTAPLNTEPRAGSQWMPAFNVAKTVTEPLAVASGCQTQPALKYSW